MSTPYAILNIVAGTASVAAIVAYNVWFARMVARDPESTVVGLTNVSRKAWVLYVSEKKLDILAVQTLRSWATASSLLGSTSVIIIFFFVTFFTNATKGPPLDNPTGIALEAGFQFDTIFSIKVILILIIYMAAFFCHAQAIRFFNHVALVININLTEEQITRLNSDGKTSYHPVPHTRVAEIMNRGALFHQLGLRAFYISFPLFAYLWGPWYLILSTVLLLFVLRHVDFNTTPWRRPKRVPDARPPSPSTPATAEAGAAVALIPVSSSSADASGGAAAGSGMEWRTATAERASRGATCARGRSGDGEP